jgi:hypothetical protein
MAKSKRKMAKRKTAKRRPTTRKATRRPAGRLAPKGYAFVVKIGDDYLTETRDYSGSQPDARRFTRRPGAADMVKIKGDRRRPRVVKLHPRQSATY